MSFVGAAGWTLLVLVLLEVSLATIDAVHPGALSDLVTVTACKVLAHSLVLFAIVRAHEPDTALREVLGLRRPALLALLLAAAVGAGFAFPASFMQELLSHRFPVRPEDAALYEQLYSVATPAKRAVLFGAGVVVIPITNELFFRGALFTPLARGRRVGAVVFATAAFDALLAFDPRGVAPMLLLVLALGFIRVATGSVVPSIVARVAFFAVNFAPAALGREDAPTTRPFVLGGLGAALLGLAALALLGRRARRSHDEPLDDA